MGAAKPEAACSPRCGPCTSPAWGCGCPTRPANTRGFRTKQRGGRTSSERWGLTNKETASTRASFGSTAADAASQSAAAAAAAAADAAEPCGCSPKSDTITRGRRVAGES